MKSTFPKPLRLATALVALIMGASLLGAGVHFDFDAYYGSHQSIAIGMVLGALYIMLGWVFILAAYFIGVGKEIL